MRAVSAGSPLAASTTITGANNEIDGMVDGSPTTIDIASGTYTRRQLAQAITQASGQTLTASVDTSGQLTSPPPSRAHCVAPNHGGIALATLGLRRRSTVNGTDGQIDVDGTTTTVTDIAGTGLTQVTLASGNGGTVTA